MAIELMREGFVFGFGESLGFVAACVLFVIVASLVIVVVDLVARALEGRRDDGKHI